MLTEGGVLAHLLVEVFLKCLQIVRLHLGVCHCTHHVIHDGVCIHGVVVVLVTAVFVI